MKAVLDTWVLVERYKRNQHAVRLLRQAGRGELEAYVSHVTVAELVNVIGRVYGERQARIQYAYLRHAPIVMKPTSDQLAKNAGLFKTKYRFSLADGFILSTALDLAVDILVTGGQRQFEEEWSRVTEVRVVKLDEFFRPAA